MGTETEKINQPANPWESLTQVKSPDTRKMEKSNIGRFVATHAGIPFIEISVQVVIERPYREAL